MKKVLTIIWPWLKQCLIIWKRKFCQFCPQEVEVGQIWLLVGDSTVPAWQKKLFSIEGDTGCSIAQMFICSQNHFYKNHFTFCKMLCGNVYSGKCAISYHYGDVYKLWLDREIRCRQALPGRSEKMTFQLQFKGCVRVLWVDEEQLGKSRKGGSVPQKLC